MLGSPLKTLRVNFFPCGPWRIGPDSGDRDRVDRIFHSDTVYSAVSSAMAQLGQIDEWLDATARAAQPAVRFSSCFPFQSGPEGTTDFVVPPRHLWPPPASSKVRWKGAKFVPLSVVHDLVHGRPISEEAWAVDSQSECLVPIGTQGPFRVSVRSNAAIDRDGSGVEPHSSACIEFARRAGLWLDIVFADDAARDRWTDPIVSVLKLLGDSGLGGERSRGWGRATIMHSSCTDMHWFPEASTTGEIAWWMLSLFHPSNTDTVDWQRGNYSLTTRTGRVESDVRSGQTKKSTRMVAEGSVLVSASEPRGSATDVAPDGFPHPVYRSGFALAIPIPLKVAS